MKVKTIQPATSDVTRFVEIVSPENELQERSHCVVEIDEDENENFTDMDRKSEIKSKLQKQLKIEQKRTKSTTSFMTEWQNIVENLSKMLYL